MAMNDSKLLWSEIRRYRIAKGVSVATMSKLIRVTEDEYKLIEDGERGFYKFSSLQIVCNYLGLNAYLMMVKPEAGLNSCKII